MNDIGNRIRRIREDKNLTQEYVASLLDISQNAYSKLEVGSTKVTIDRLYRISEIFEVPIEAFLEGDKHFYQGENKHIENFYGHIETLHNDNKELTNTTLRLLEEQINHLKKENERLLKILEEKN